MKFFGVLSATLLFFVFGKADIDCSKAVVISQIGATPAEVHAAQELRDYLSKITGANILLRTGAADAPKNAIIVGQGPVTRKLLPDCDWSKLGAEQTLVRTVGDRLVVAGGRSRGTLYAVYRLLQEKGGVRWWTPWATTIPSNSSLKLGALNWSETPAFEYRDPYWFHSFDADWAARNFDNGFNTRVGAERGGKVEYAGFVHTYNGLVPPDLFSKHPEWFSLIGGKRTNQNAQLCTTNPALRDFVVEQVKKTLRANPKATIISVSQNDCFNPCQCEVCQALAEREGSQAALVLDLANYVGQKIEKEFPNVAVDTLAYQWSRHPTRTMRPRPNVIVRLCSIECNFAYPLSAPENASFGDDIRGWSKLTNRLYVWDYCTDFAHYMLPFPDYFSLPATIQWFSENGVKGVFEEGDYSSNGGDMAELKAWVTAQLLWNPEQNPEGLINEFLAGYYGPAAASIRAYMDLLAGQAKQDNLTFAAGFMQSYLDYPVMLQAETLWRKAEASVAGDPVLTWRVAQSHINPQYAWICRWMDYRRETLASKTPWPVNASRAAFAEAWLKRATTPGPEGWNPVTTVNEGGYPPKDFVKSLGTDQPDPVFHAPPVRQPNAAPPTGLTKGIDLQDDRANLWQVPTGCELRSDPLASDGAACWMPGNHHEWAFQIPLSKVHIEGRYKLYVVARVDSGPRDESVGFSTGIWDNANRRDVMTYSYPLTRCSSTYQTYEIGTFDLTQQMTIWAAPPANPKVQSVWIDRVYLVRA